MDEFSNNKISKGDVVIYRPGWLERKRILHSGYSDLCDTRPYLGRWRVVKVRDSGRIAAIYRIGEFGDKVGLCRDELSELLERESQ